MSGHTGGRIDDSSQLKESVDCENSEQNDFEANLSASCWGRGVHPGKDARDTDGWGAVVGGNKERDQESTARSIIGDCFPGPHGKISDTPVLDELRRELRLEEMRGHHKKPAGDHPSDPRPDRGPKDADDNGDAITANNGDRITIDRNSDIGVRIEDKNGEEVTVLNPDENQRPKPGADLPDVYRLSNGAKLYSGGFVASSKYVVYPDGDRVNISGL